MRGPSARRISTIADVLAVLASDRGSFAEWMDCMEVGKVAGRTDLVEKCAVQALEAVDVKRIGPSSLQQAARLLVGALLASVEPRALRHLPEAAIQATARLDQVIATIRSENARVALASERSRLAALPLLLDEGSTASLTKACSLLRKLHRPDLGREAATRGLRVSPDDPAALTTRGAAAADERDYESALTDLRRAWGLRRDSRTGTSLTRTLIASEQFTEAIAVAEETADLEPSHLSFNVLAAAAWAGGDEAARRAASSRLQDLQEGDPEDEFESMRWPAVLAARQLIRDGELDLAERTLLEILQSGPYVPAEKVLRQVEALRQRRQLARRNGRPCDDHDPAP